MTAPQHTPGPWHHKRGQFTPFNVYAANSEDIAWVSLGTRNPYAHEDEMEANARLIASAPDLLAACQMLVAKIERYHVWIGDPSDDYAPDMMSARNAIARATGQPSPRLCCSCGEPAQYDDRCATCAQRIADEREAE